ncbi:MAG: UDP-glucose 4-epimerase GalE [Gammaproteobacteria bacterium]|nr:UDP-glucose 4-epimerase GalE [Gammaproteobacteria bacterium]
MKLLIPGGAGYIGCHMVRYAQEHGHEVVVLDDFSTGHEWAVKDCEILRVNLLDQDKLSQLLKGRHFDGVIHFAAKSLVGESVKKPELYYRNNVVGTLNLVNEMLNNDVNNLVFSSTAAIFGNPVTEKIAEDHPKNPINPYGQSKLMVENMLRDICSANDFNVTCFRYFNAAGAHESGEIGESHNPETHLIPNILKAALSNESSLKVFGNDYPTPDGTCVRDYVHVTDLAQAHLLGLEYMQSNKGFSAYNLGNGDGFSVLEVIEGCEKIADTKISFQIDGRREGDPASLVADSRKAKELLGWDGQFGYLDKIVSTALEWHKTHKDEL